MINIIDLIQAKFTDPWLVLEKLRDKLQKLRKLRKKRRRKLDDQRDAFNTTDVL